MADNRVAIVGGGIAGLAAAHDLLGSGFEVQLFEANERLGGRISSMSFQGAEIPTAADAFLARVPQMIDLARRVGLGDSLITPAAQDALIYRSSALHPLPPTLLGIPADLDSLAESALVTPAGIERARLDLTAVDDRPDGDESVGALVRRRLGDEIHEYLVDPLLGGINAGDSDRLSITYGIPQVRAARDRHHSLIEAARSLRAMATPGEPVFFGIRGGLQVLIDAVARDLDADAHTVVRCGVSVERIVRHADRWLVDGAPFDHVIVALPPGRAANVLEEVAAETADRLRAIDTSSVAMTLIALAPDSTPVPPTVSGVLVPRLEGLHVTAVSVATNKWPELSDRQILRVSVGRRTDTRWKQLETAELHDVIIDDLRMIFGCEFHPLDMVTVEWNDALPQYDVDHGLRIDAAESALAEQAPRVHLAGAALRGLGLPACVQSGRDAAAAVRNHRSG